MVERKNEAAVNRMTIQSSQGDRTKNINEQSKAKLDNVDDAEPQGQDCEPANKEQFEEKDLIQTEGMYELHRKKKINQRLVRGYCQMLDVDYNHNRMVVCGYQAHILKTVGQIIIKKYPQFNKNKK